MPEVGDCEKCRGVLLSAFGRSREPLEPWCRQCAQEHRSEYAPIFTKWVMEKASEVLKGMGVPLAYRSCSFESFEAKTKEQRHALRVAKEWVASTTPGLFLCGPVGTGKTHLAVSALLAMRAERFTGQFVSALELLLKCRNSFRSGDGPEELLERYSMTSVLLLDDLGAEKPTEFSREVLSLIVDRAYREESSLIVTSNFDFEGLAERIDERTADRLVELCQAVKVSGASYRQKRAIERARLRNLPTSEVLQ
jgi:DNA replication protein DnaC